jgi:RNA polymerase sigma-70 factor (ECF subfamily)
MITMRMETYSMQSAITFDKQAVVEIYERHSDEIYRYAYRQLGDSAQAEDCVSETFSRFIQALRSGAAPENIRAYLYRTAHNWITDVYRRKPLPDLALDDDFHIDPLGNPAHVVAEEMDRQLVRSAMLRLPAEQRQVLELRFMENWPHDEIAALLGKSVEATRALQHRALEALRRMLVDPRSGQEVQL